MRILQVVTVMNRGGLETMLMNYYRKIDRTKMQFDFMVHREEEGDYDEEIKRLGGTIYRMPPIRPGSYQKYFKKLDRFFKKNNSYKVVHAHINENSSFVLRAAHRAGVPCRIAHSHLSDLGIDMKLPFRLYARMSMKNYPNHYFACSKKAGEWLFGRRVANSSMLHVLNNAVNAEDFSFNENVRNEKRKELNVGNRLVIGHIGRFNKQKNHEFLIDIFKNVHDVHPNALLVLVGDGDLKRAIQKKVASLKLQSSVRFLGVRQDIAQLMQAFDIFLFPSLFEGLPVVLVEAQASGLSCIVSDTITAESNITGRMQFLSLNDSPQTWAERILSTSTVHVDTSETIRQAGYDTATMAKWLMNYYFKHSSHETTYEVSGGN